MRRRLLPFLIAALACCLARCGGTNAGSGSGGGTNPNPPANVQVTVSPSPTNIRLGNTQQFTATVTGTSNPAVAWSVNGAAGGNGTVGSISASGMYTAPANMPSSNSITITATSAADSSATGNAAVTLWNPTPALTSVTPSTFATGSFSLTITGSKFVQGAEVTLGGAQLTTTFTSSTQLTATGTAATAGTFAVVVTNPNPGSSASGSVNVTVTSNGGGGGGGGGGGNALACNGMSLGAGASLNGFVPFPADNLWNTNIASAAVDPNSANIIQFIGGTTPLHPDFGSGEFDGSIIGIPYVIVGSGQAFVNVAFTDSPDESDPGPMPIPANAPIEGDPNPSGDQHVLVLDNQNCWLYELFSAMPQADGTWNAGSAAVWDLLNDEQRPWTWTSADAAGLSIFAGLARYDEVAAGEIKHALRFTLNDTIQAFTPPASHWAATSTAQFAAPMGMRMRLKPTFDISGFSPTNQVILTAMQQYGIILADNGSNMFISGAPDSRWNNDDLHNLNQVTAADFDVLLIQPLYTKNNVPTGAAPTIASFTATPASVSAGGSVTLDWSATNAGYYIVSPQVGAVRGASVTVNPAATTTYTLAATNQFGRTTATVTVTVQ